MDLERPRLNKQMIAAPEGHRGHVYKIDTAQVADLLGCPSDEAMRKFWNDHDERLKIASN